MAKQLVILHDRDQWTVPHRIFRQLFLPPTFHNAY
jgi:hypothetical protein